MENVEMKKFTVQLGNGKRLTNRVCKFVNGLSSRSSSEGRTFAVINKKTVAKMVNLAVHRCFKVAMAFLYTNAKFHVFHPINSRISMNNRMRCFAKNRENIQKFNEWLNERFSKFM